MSYIKHILQPEEKLLVVGRLHWVIYLPAVFWFLCAGGAAVAAYYVRDTNYLWLVSLALLCVFFLLGLAQLIHAWWHAFTTEIAVTNHRVIYKTGFINRRTNEMNVDKIESVKVDQSIFGRLLGYGTIDIRGTGEGIEQLRRISHAIELRNAITSR